MPTPGQRISEYVLERPLGRGAFGEVWRARHHAWTDRVVAIKFPSDLQYLRQLQREGLVCAGVDHLNIVRPLGFDPYADPPYLVMELVDGPNLRSVISSGRRDIDLAIAITRQILTGLVAAHARGIIHGDLKPENVLIATAVKGQPLVKLSDFGLSTPQAESGASIVFSRSLDQGEAIAGTIEYMSPEQRGGGPIDARADLYAVGVILHELLTGERPAGTDLPSAINPQVPHWIDDVFRRAYARLDRRFASAADMLETLSASGVPAASNDGAISPTICPQCRGRVAPGDQFCIRCGVQLVRDVRRCPACQAFPAVDDAYCTFCGVSLPAPAAR